MRNIEEIFGGVVENQSQKPWTYIATGLETQEPDGTYSIPIPFVFSTMLCFNNGNLQTEAQVWADSTKIYLVDQLEEGDTLFFLFNSSMSIDRIKAGNISEYKFIVPQGGLESFVVDRKFDHIIVTINGATQANEITCSVVGQTVYPAMALEEGDLVYCLLIQGELDNDDKITNLEAVSRDYKVSVNEVVIGRQETPLDGVKVLFDPIEQTGWLIPDCKGERVVAFNPPMLKTDKQEIDLTQFNIDRNNFFLKSQYSFEKGFTLQHGLQTVIFEGQEYRWGGEFPKVVTDFEEDLWILVNGTPHHRKTPEYDLAAIDRRPDGYSNNIQSVLENGGDVEINKDYAITKQLSLKENQKIVGAGGEIHVLDGKESGVFVKKDGLFERDGILLHDLVFRGSVKPDKDTPESVGSYAVHADSIKNITVNNIRAEGFTGAVALRNTYNSLIDGLLVNETVYHSQLYRGGYGVFTDCAKDAFLNNIKFDVGSGTNGRHLAYISVGYDNPTGFNGNENIILNNLIGRYKDKDDRNFPVVNYRKTRRTVLNNLITEGSNFGVSYNPEQGDITHTVLSNSIINVVSYSDDVAVFGVGQLVETKNDYRNRGFIQNNLILNIEPKTETLSGKSCVGTNISGTDGIVSDIVTNLFSVGSPISIQPGAENISISNILDYCVDNESQNKTALITFAGGVGTIKNVKVSNLKTDRPIFNRITVAEDVSVDFIRIASVLVGSSKEDPWELLERVAIGSDSITLLFHKHVTSEALNGTLLKEIFLNNKPLFAKLTIVENTKHIKVDFYDSNGARVSPDGIEFKIQLFE